MSRLIISPLARSDLRSIWTYTFEQWGRAQANSYIGDINAHLAKIAEAPGKGRLCDYIREGYCKTSVGSHIVFYLRIDDGIDVKRVLHQSMDFQRHL